MRRDPVFGLSALLALATAALPMPTNGAWLLDATPVVAERSPFRIEFEDLNGDETLTNVLEITHFSGVTVFTNFRSTVTSVPLCLPSSCVIDSWIFGTESEGHVVVYARDWTYTLTGPPTPDLTATPQATSTPTPRVCVGDCDGDGVVAISELVLSVGVVLGTEPAGACSALANHQGTVDIAQLITGVRNALGGCGA